MDDLILRSAYLTGEDDVMLRELAERLGIPKSDILQAAISLKLVDWLAVESNDLIRADLDAVRKPRKEATMEHATEDLDAIWQPADDDSVVGSLVTIATLVAVGITGFLFLRHMRSRSK